MKVTASDGRQWRVFRRRLAWRPRLPRWVVEWFPEGWPDDNIVGLVVGVYATILLLIMSPFLVWFVLAWLACLLLTPIAWMARTTLGRPTPVIAHLDDNPWAEWSGSADGRAAADDLAQRVADELARFGAPRSLTAPSAELRELRKRNKLLEQENEILRRPRPTSPKRSPQNDVPAGRGPGRRWDPHRGDLPGPGVLQAGVLCLAAPAADLTRRQRRLSDQRRARHPPRRSGVRLPVHRR